MDTQLIITQMLDSMSVNEKLKQSFMQLASNKNSELINSVNILKNTKDDRTVINSYYKNRLQRMTENLTNAFQEHKQNMKLVESYKVQYGGEEHQLKVMERERGGLCATLAKTQAEHDDIDVHTDKAKSTIAGLQVSLDQHSESIHIGKSVLCEWKALLSSNTKMEEMIQKYSKIDSAKVGVIDSKRKLLLSAILKQKKVLLDASKEQKSLEQELERTSQLYRHAFNERKDLMVTWKNTLNHMNVRECDILNLESTFEKVREEGQVNLATLNQESQTYEEKMSLRQGLEEELEELNRDHSIVQQRFLELEEILKTNLCDFACVRKMVQNVSEKLVHQRCKNRDLLQEEQKKELFTRNGVSQLEQLRNKFESFKSSSSNALERFNQLDGFVENELNAIKNMETEFSKLSTTFKKSEQQLSEITEKYNLMVLDRKGVEASIRRAKENVRISKKDLNRLSLIAYRLGYSLQQATVRLANINGINVFEDDSHLTDRIRSLENTFSDKKRAVSIVQFQISKIQGNLKNVTQEFHRTSKELEGIYGKLKETKVKVEGGENIFKQNLKLNHEKIVDINLIRMKLKQMERHLAQHEQKAYNLDKHKFEMETVINERELELKSQKQVLVLKKKCLNSQKSELKMEITERDSKIKCLKERWECVVSLLGVNDDGTLVTAVQIKVETAQQKHILLTTGNALNKQVQELEDNIKLIETVLKLMMHSNDAYKKSFELLTGEIEAEAKIVDSLVNDHCCLLNQLKQLRSALNKKLMKVESLNLQKQEVEKLFEEAEKNRLDSNDVLVKLQKEFIDQKEKVDRAERDLQLAIRSVRRKHVDSDFLYLFERDLNTQELEERDNSALHQLADCVTTYPEIGPAVTRYLYEKGLKMPSRNVTVWRSGDSLSDYNLRVDRMCSRMTNKTFMSSSASSTSTAKGVKKTSANISVVTLDFPGSSTSTRSNKHPQ